MLRHFCTALCNKMYFFSSISYVWKCSLVQVLHTKWKVQGLLIHRLGFVSWFYKNYISFLVSRMVNCKLMWRYVKGIVQMFWSGVMWNANEQLKHYIFLYLYLCAAIQQKLSWNSFWNFCSCCCYYCAC